jgi:hypothetical protein
MTNYGALQLPLYDRCDVCGSIVFGGTTGVPNPPHRACFEAIERWVVRRNDDTRTNYPVYTRRRKVAP